MSQFWHELWPQVLAVGFAAGVLGNLAASLMWATPALIHLHRKLDRLHAERMAQGVAHHEKVMAAVGESRKDFALTVQALSSRIGSGGAGG